MNSHLKKHKRATIALGTLVEVSIWLDEPIDVNPYFQAAYQSLNQMQQLMSLHNDTSDLGRYRLAQIGDEIEIHSHTARVLAFSEVLWAESSGYFDVCSGYHLVVNGYLPNNMQNQQLNYKARTHPLKINYLPDHVAKLTKMEDNLIDLGGVAKGYAIDEVIKTLQNLHVAAAMVNAGGDMRIFGDVEELIHIRKNEHFVPLCVLNNKALATSAMPSNWQQNSKHLPIVNPKTQRCIDASDESMSILADTAMTADALTKLAWLGVLDSKLLERYNAKII